LADAPPGGFSTVRGGSGPTEIPIGDSTPTAPASFPQVSNPQETTAQNQPWGVNASERVLDTQGRSQGRQGQWLRKCSLVAYGAASNPNQGDFGGGGDKGASQGGIELSNMRITFDLHLTVDSQPNQLHARVYNLSKKTQDQVKQFGRIQLAAGYQTDNYGTIFDGSVAIYIVGKESAVDSYLEIFAGDADTYINGSTSVLTFPAGTTPEDKVKKHTEQMGLRVGTINMGPGGKQPSLRASAYCGMSWRAIRDLTNACSSDWYVENGTAHAISWNGYRESEVVILSPKTGLVNIPKVTPDGIEAECLLNPKLRLGTLVQIDTGLLTDVPFIPGDPKPFSGTDPQTGTSMGDWSFEAPALSPTGVYKILTLGHNGDTRGNPWYSHIVCVAAGQDGTLLQGAWHGNALDRTMVPATSLGTPGRGQNPGNAPALAPGGFRRAR
jgi:hypothetical protein